MRRAVVLVVAVALLGGEATIGQASPPRFSGWAADPRTGKQGYPPRRRLDPYAKSGAPTTLVFVDRVHANTRYKACVNRRDGMAKCFSARTGDAGRKNGRAIFPLPIGGYTATWTVAGKIVTHWTFRVAR